MQQVERDHAERMRVARNESNRALDREIAKIGAERAAAVTTLKAARDATLATMKGKA